GPARRGGPVRNEPRWSSRLGSLRRSSGRISSTAASGDGEGSDSPSEVRFRARDPASPGLAGVPPDLQTTPPRFPATSSSASDAVETTDPRARHHPLRRTGRSNDARTDARPPSPSRHAPPASRLLELDGPADGDHAQSNERYGDPRRPPECGDSNPHSFGGLRFTSADRHQRPGRVHLAAAAELRQGHAVAVLELDPDRQAEADRVGLDAAQVGDDADALVRLDHRDDIGHIGRERGVHRLVHGRPREHGPPPARPRPRPAVGAAAGAPDPGWVAPRAAPVAALEAQFARRAELVELGRQPLERGARLRDRGRFGPAHRSRPRIARLPSPKSPHPVTSPVSHPATWAAPASWRSCRVASTMWFIPQMWPCESNPPCVFIGYRPPSSIVPPCTNSAASPRPQMPRASSSRSTT